MLQKTFQVSKIKGAVIIAAVGLAVWGFGAAARAVIIAPGQTLPTTGVTSFAGPVLLNTGPVPFVGTDFLHNVHFTGDLTTQVISGTQGLDFVYQFTNNDNSPDSILTFSTAVFSGFTTNADYLAGSGGGFPTTVNRDSNNSGDTITFAFPLASAVNPGSNSVDLVVQTNATAFTLGTVSVQDGGNASISAPAPLAVPEPATAAIAGFALLSLGMRRRNAARS